MSLRVFDDVLERITLYECKHRLIKGGGQFAFWLPNGMDIDLLMSVLLLLIFLLWPRCDWTPVWHIVELTWVICYLALMGFLIVNIYLRKNLWVLLCSILTNWIPFIQFLDLVCIAILQKSTNGLF